MLLDALAKIGHSGVDLFFVISGYLIYGALIRKREFSYFPFVRRRATRIYPTFLAVLGVYLALSVLLPQQSRFPQGVSASMVYLGQNLLLLPGLFSIMPIMTVSC
jgi:peptidoglycan/LPS O-acetylase OafA/YrhL